MFTPKAKKESEEYYDEEQEPAGCKVIESGTQKESVVILHGPITTENIADAIQQIIVANLSEQKRLHLVIMSSGGNLTAAFGLIDTMAGSAIPIITYGIGEVLSAGLLIFMAGHHRVLGRNTSILSHQFSTGSGWNKFHEMEALERGLKMTQKQVIEFYIKATQLPLRIIKAKLLSSSDTWLTAEEALKYNLADEVVDGFSLYTLGNEPSEGVEPMEPQLLQEENENSTGV